MGKVNIDFTPTKYSADDAPDLVTGAYNQSMDDLKTALDNATAEDGGATGDYLPLTGGTLTGNLTVENNDIFTTISPSSIECEYERALITTGFTSTNHTPSINMAYQDKNASIRLDSNELSLHLNQSGGAVGISISLDNIILAVPITYNVPDDAVTSFKNMATNIQYGDKITGLLGMNDFTPTAINIPNLKKTLGVIQTTSVDLTLTKWDNGSIGGEYIPTITNNIVGAEFVGKSGISTPFVSGVTMSTYNAAKPTIQVWAMTRDEVESIEGRLILFYV